MSTPPHRPPPPPARTSTRTTPTACCSGPRRSAATPMRSRPPAKRSTRYGVDLRVQTPRGQAPVRVGFSGAGDEPRRPARSHGRTGQGRPGLDAHGLTPIAGRPGLPGERWARPASEGLLAFPPATCRDSRVVARTTPRGGRFDAQAAEPGRPPHHDHGCRPPDVDRLLGGHPGHALRVRAVRTFDNEVREPPLLRPGRRPA